MILPDTDCAWAFAKHQQNPFTRSLRYIVTLSFNLEAGFWMPSTCICTVLCGTFHRHDEACGHACSTWNHVARVYLKKNR